jgi:hypothetical protein
MSLCWDLSPDWCFATVTAPPFGFIIFFTSSPCAPKQLPSKEGLMRSVKLYFILD